MTNGRMDLTAPHNLKMFTKYLEGCLNANYGVFNDWEQQFIQDLNSEYQRYGSNYSPTRKQWNQLRDLYGETQ